ncbi:MULTISPECIES: PqqD family peptide modification chaperone [Clostridiaceae]|uniref:Coenzyme PQQ synthesis protein D (PqqD) n=1 Tax=Caloramator proteoclasticus DSM 10124 TaxID=1121262 RepID=A0A1M4X9E7_9CLOT|nr:MULTISPECIES: PqqD family peptide modification chaperone [Clostridiaceae]SHE90093.1 Coenzyme PQQ synthesis protein D (PqqD) [Caloramator proteoclasticus DSM 10124]
MLLQNNNFYPLFSEEYVSYLYDEENGRRYLISKQYRSLDKLVLNREGKIILDNCNGKNTIADIIKKLGEIYPEVPYETLNNDVNNLLFTCWRIGIIQWLNLDINLSSPYHDLFNNTIDNYTCSILSGENLIKIFSQTNNLKCKNKYIPAFVFNENTLRDYSFYNIEQYCAITHIDKLVMLFGISRKNSKSLTVEINFYYLDEEHLDKKESLSNFIQWAIEVFSKFSNTRFNSIEATALKNDIHSQKIIEGFGFKKVGELKSEIFEENENNFLDLCIYRKNIKYDKAFKTN